MAVALTAPRCRYLQRRGFLVFHGELTQNALAFALASYPLSTLHSFSGWFRDTTSCVNRGFEFFPLYNISVLPSARWAAGSQ